MVVCCYHCDMMRYRYSKPYVPRNVLTSMRRWDHQDSDTVPRHVDEAGMLWLQRLLVGRDATRRPGMGLDEYGPTGLHGLRCQRWARCLTAVVAHTLLLKSCTPVRCVNNTK
jgi:hypothetical protein